MTEILVFCKGRFSRFVYTVNRNVDFRFLLKLGFVFLTYMNRLVLISCCWLLKKTLVITTNLTNPESASVKRGNSNYIMTLLPWNWLKMRVSAKKIVMVISIVQMIFIGHVLEAPGLYQKTLLLKRGWNTAQQGFMIIVA